eukprot:jgi/Hompol1/728/HPOL_002568-RA
MYRDRAKERREGTSTDFDDPLSVYRMLQTSLQHSEGHDDAAADEQQKSEPETDDKEPTAAVQVSKSADDLELEDMFDDTDEQSSHLQTAVKSQARSQLEMQPPPLGLDFEMLRKTRQAAQQKADIAQSEQEAIAYVESVHTGSTGVVKCLTLLTQSIYDLAFKLGKTQPIPSRAELMQPGRSAFVWDLGFNDKCTVYMGSSDAPSTLLRPKQDQAKNREMDDGVSEESQMIVEKLVGLFEHLNVPQTAPVSAPQPPPAIVNSKSVSEAEIKPPKSDVVDKTGKPEPEFFDMEENDGGSDIFSDAGTDYVAEIDPNRKRVSESAANASTDEPEEGEVNVSSPTVQTTTSIATRHGYFLKPDDDSDARHNAVSSSNATRETQLALAQILRQNAGAPESEHSTFTAEKLVGHLAATAAAAASASNDHAGIDAKLDSSELIHRSSDSMDHYASASAVPLHDSDASSAAILAARSVPTQRLQGLSSSSLIDRDMDSGSDDAGSDADEIDTSQIDHGIEKNKKRQLSKFDFETEEEWIAYKETQVHMPKAAFQFGVKVAEGRKKEIKDKDKRGTSEETKFSREYQQLEKLYRSKYGSGLGDDNQEPGQGQGHAQAGGQSGARSSQERGNGRGRAHSRAGDGSSRQAERPNPFLTRVNAPGPSSRPAKRIKK